jgi:hypothetical protein
VTLLVYVARMGRILVADLKKKYGLVVLVVDGSII